MPTLTGTSFNDIITTTTISVGVVGNPLNSFPGAGTDVINAGDGADFVSAGGGATLFARMGPGLALTHQDFLIV